MRPAEWVMLVFFAVLGLHAAFFPRGDAGGGIWIIIAQAPLVVALGQGVARYRRTPWPDDLAPGVSALYRIVLGLSALPLAVECGQFLFLQWLDPNHGNDVAARLTLGVLALIRIGAEKGIPFLLVGVGLGLHLKFHGRFDARAVPKELGATFAGPVRDWIPPTLLVAAYQWVGGVLFNGSSRAFDAQLALMDRRMFGVDPVAWLGDHVGPLGSEWLTLAYASYFLFLPLVPALLYVRRDKRPFHEFALAITLTFVLGYVGYALLPARGPGFTIHYPHALNNIHTVWIQRQLVAPNLIARDAFPSLHTAFGFLTLWALWRHARRLFWVALPIAGSIPIACVYLRYHYVIDVMGGAALFAVVTQLAPWLSKRSTAVSAEGAPRAVPSG